MGENTSMNPIPIEQVEQTWNQMNELGEGAIAGLIEEMGQNQPLLLVYLISVGDGTFNEAEEEYFFFLGSFVWQALKDGKEELPEITEKVLMEAEASGVEMLEKLESSPMDATHFVDRLLESYPQRFLLGFVIEELMEEDDPEIRDDTRAMMLVFIKVIIDCLDRKEPMTS